MRLLPFLLLVLACGASAAVPNAREADESVWRELQQTGDTERAGQAFARWREEGRIDGLVGAMTLAMIQGKMGELATLAEDLDPAALEEPALIARAALALGELRPIPAQAVQLGLRCCDFAENAVDRETHLAGIEACSFARLAQVSPRLDQCTEGCESAHRFPLLFASNLAVVQASINGDELAPFIVDTGASISVITREFAEAHQIEAVEGTVHSAGSPGGLLEVHRAMIDVQVGGLRVERVSAIIVDLPIDFIGGIISPQSTWRGLVTEFDFRTMRVHVSPVARASDGMPDLPLLFSERIPFLRAAIGGRRAVPILLDTGASGTSLFTSWEALPGEPIERGSETRVSGAGGGSARAWNTSGSFEAQAGSLRWSVHQPTIAERGDSESVHREIRYWGLIGMDLMMGRRVQLDMNEHVLRISEQQVLPSWPVGSTTRYRIEAQDWSDDIVLTERVIERGRDEGTELLTIDVSYTGEREGHFRFQMADRWDTRGTWLISRPVLRMWDVGDDGSLTEVAEDERAQRWLSVLMPFQTDGEGVEMRFLPIEREGQEPLSCTEISVPAAAEVGEVTLEILECPTETWRTQRLTLRNEEGGVVYKFEVQSD